MIEYFLNDPSHEDPLETLVRSIEGTEDVVEIARKGTTVAVLIDVELYNALLGEAEGRAY